MRLSAPLDAPVKQFTDVNSQQILIGNGKPTLLAFFRDARCPFCNFRVFELTKEYDRIAESGLNVVAVFSADKDDVQRFITQRERPFPVVADPDSSLHDDFGIETVEHVNKMSLMMKYFLKMLRGMMLVGPMEAMKSDSEILPADFLIGAGGQILETYYGEDYADRMPIEDILAFAERQ